MSAALPRLYVVRHGDTEWTDSHRKTGRTDLPLNARGERNALQLGERLRSVSFDHVFTSPLQRAFKTCELAGFASVAETDPDLVEWNYGRFEGMTTHEIQREKPGWELFRDGCPDGDSSQDVARRADRFIARVHDCGGNVLAFSSGHIIRMIAARWHRLPPAAARIFYCNPASIGVLGFEHDSGEEPIVRLWNDSIETMEFGERRNSSALDTVPR
jgi:broad specificity phosphatase PhoE